MNTKRYFKITGFTLLFAFTCITTNAQHRFYRVHHRPVTVVSRPVATVHVSNRFSQKERLAIAIAYLKEHECLTIKKYAQMTQLTKETAKAELNAFAMDSRKPIIAVANGNKKVYKIRG